MSIFDFFLIFSKETIILPLSIFLLVKDHKKYISVILILLISGLYSHFLKNIFSIPYNQETILILGKNGFSFPSGHMLSSICFYGYLMCKSQNKVISLLFSFILLMIGISLINKGYHNLYDITGSIVFGLALIMFFIKAINYIENKYNYSDYKIQIFIFAFIFILLFSLTIIFYEIKDNHIKNLIIMLAMLSFLLKKVNFIIIYFIINVIFIYLIGYINLIYFLLLPFVLRIIIIQVNKEYK